MKKNIKKMSIEGRVFVEISVQVSYRLDGAGLHSILVVGFCVLAWLFYTLNILINAVLCSFFVHS